MNSLVWNSKNKNTQHNNTEDSNMTAIDIKPEILQEILHFAYKPLSKVDAIKIEESNEDRDSYVVISNNEKRTIVVNGLIPKETFSNVKGFGIGRLNSFSGIVFFDRFSNDSATIKGNIDDDKNLKDIKFTSEYDQEIDFKMIPYGIVQSLVDINEGTGFTWTMTFTMNKELKSDFIKMARVYLSEKESDFSVEIDKLDSNNTVVQFVLAPDSAQRAVFPVASISNKNIDGFDCDKRFSIENFLSILNHHPEPNLRMSNNGIINMNYGNWNIYLMGTSE